MTRPSCWDLLRIKSMRTNTNSNFQGWLRLSIFLLDSRLRSLHICEKRVSVLTGRFTDFCWATNQEVSLHIYVSHANLLRGASTVCSTLRLIRLAHQPTSIASGTLHCIYRLPCSDHLFHGRFLDDVRLSISFVFDTLLDPSCFEFGWVHLHCTQ